MNEGETSNGEIQLSSGEWLPLPGNVTSYQPGIGFGVALLIQQRTDGQVITVDHQLGVADSVSLSVWLWSLLAR